MSSQHQNLTRLSSPGSSGPTSLRRDARVIGLVGLGHGVSHFFQLALPPLFPMLRAEFDVSWTLLGALIGVFYAASGVMQFVSGFLVDRLGARRVLLTGMALLAGSTILAAFIPGIGWLFPIVILMGLGNGVFHPADFAILNANVEPRRLGHAYSTHGIMGNLGYAISPIASFALASAFGWRGGLAAMGVIGLVVLGVLATQRAWLTSQKAEGPKHTLAGSVSLFRQSAILACFVYFILQTTGSIGLQTFAASALNNAFDIALVLANSAVTAFLLGGSAGIFAGGFLASRTTRHDRVATMGLLVGAALACLAAAGPPSALLLPLFAAIGFAVGSTGPSRDLIVRNATPKGAAGRVYGFVYCGLDIGATLGPLMFGIMLDHGLGQQVFIAVAVLFALAVMTVGQATRAMARGVPSP